MVVKWGVMGTANIAGKIVHTIGRAEGCEVVAVASRSLERYILAILLPLHFL
jgi:predicted dehydrogenase